MDCIWLKKCNGTQPYSAIIRLSLKKLVLDYEKQHIMHDEEEYQLSEYYAK